ncbi:TrkH family potassium uptake protein [Candidatus Peregrinibacteria bacterium]|nr:TrkH family potassium uptake protein [Candidatus Peregrinibacteria bacterium]
MKLILRYLGYLLIVSALFRIVPILTALNYGESIISFVLTTLVSLILGGVFVYIARFKPDDKQLSLTLSNGLMLVAISFIIIPLFGAVTFLPSLEYNFLDAYFESISGFTTTGLTMYHNLDALPKSLLMWRAMIQWIGGIGIIMVFLFIFSRLHSHDYVNVKDAESKAQSTMALYQSQGFTQKLEGGLKKTVSNVLIIYFGLTLIGLVLLFIAGMPFYDSVAMSFTSLSTGGFSVHDTFYTNGFQLIVLCFLMLAGSISFVTHNKLLQKKWKDFLFSFEKNVLFLMIIVAFITTLLVSTDVKNIAFVLISAFTTTGYSTTALALLPQLFIMMIMLGMLIGGGLASTSGGIKVFRVYYLLRTIPWSIKKLASPSKAIIPLSIHGEKVDEAKIVNISIFVYTYFLILLIGIVTFMAFGHDFFTSSFQMISALGTVGLQTADLSMFNPILKVILMIAMLFGRLEIFPLLILFKKMFSR